MLKHRKMQYDKAGPRVAEALNKRYFEAYYCSDREEGLKKVLELIPGEHTVSWGGTMTVDELGIKDALRRRGQAVIDRDTARDPREREQMLKQALTCDTFLMSANGISADGQLVNIDGTGNRVAALCFGPEQVIVVAGMNKVAGDLAGPESRPPLPMPSALQGSLHPAPQPASAPTARAPIPSAASLSPRASAARRDASRWF